MLHGLYNYLPVDPRKHFDVLDDGLEGRQQQVKLSHILFPGWFVDLWNKGKGEGKRGSGGHSGCVQLNTVYGTVWYRMVRYMGNDSTLQYSKVLYNTVHDITVGCSAEMRYSWSPFRTVLYIVMYSETHSSDQMSLLCSQVLCNIAQYMKYSVQCSTVQCAV